MDLNLAPVVADTTIFEGEGGGYYLWSASKYPVLSESKVGGSKLVLHPLGFALPHYADSAKIGYVLQGTCTVGMVKPNSPKETVVVINKGDVIPVPLGVVSWWFNGGDTDVAIIFLGETAKVHTPGQFTYFFLTGSLGFLGAFSTNFISRAFDLDHGVFDTILHKESRKLVKSQKGAMIIKLETGIVFPEPSDNSLLQLYASIDDALPHHFDMGGGILNALTETEFDLLGEIGLSATLAKLEPNAVFGPIFGPSGWVSVSYVTKGSGQIEIAGAAGSAVVESKVKAGHMFVVPRFLATVCIAGGDGMEIFSVITCSKPVIGELAGKRSVWKALSPVVLQVSLNVSAEFEKHFKSKIEESTVIVPPFKD